MTKDCSFPKINRSQASKIPNQQIFTNKINKSKYQVSRFSETETRNQNTKPTDINEQHREINTQVITYSQIRSRNQNPKPEDIHAPRNQYTKS